MTTTHAALPEEVMALLDGELPAEDAQAVSAHVDRCPECAHLVRQLHSTSRSLSAWNVPRVPGSVENLVTRVAAQHGSGRNVARTPLFSRASFWNWKQWAMFAGVASLLVIVSLPNALRTWDRDSRATVAYYEGRPPLTRQSSAGDRLSALQVEEQPVAKPAKRSPFSSERRGTDSNDVFHGLGTQDRDALPAVGQPLANMQNKGSSSSDPMIARTVSLSIIVKEFATSRSAVDNITERHHGYSAELSVTTPENSARALQGTLRVPAPELAAAVRDLRSLGRVESESQSGEEVTHQHEDLVARLKNSRDTEQRLRTILQQRTGKIGDILAVEEEIARVRGDIERMEAEQKTLERRVDFATIELQLTEEYKAQLNPPAASVSTRLHNALVAGYHGGSETVLGILLFLAEYGPSFLIRVAVLLLPGIPLWRRYRRSLAAL